MQKIADGEDWKMPATIDDPAILDEITESFEQARTGWLNQPDNPCRKATYAAWLIETSSIAKVRSFPASGWFMSSVTVSSFISATIAGIT